MMRKEKAPASGGAPAGAEAEITITNHINCQQHFITLFAALARQKRRVIKWQRKKDIFG